MAGAAYYRAQNLLREQAVRQTESLIITQLNVIDKDIKNKEAKLDHLLKSSDFNILTELALHANPQSSEFKEIRASVLKQFTALNEDESIPAFDQYFIMDTDGTIKVASNEKWQGLVLKDTSFIQQTSSNNSSVALFSLSPLYEDQFVLVTAREYKTGSGSILGVLIGITETANLNELIHPLQAYYPLANTYFILPSGQFISSNSQTGEFTVLQSLSTSQEKILPRLDEMINNGDTSPVALDINSAEGVATLTQLQWFPSMHAGVALELSKKAIYGNLNSLVPFTFGLAAILLIATGVVLLLGMNRVIRPLQALAEITQEFAEGDWSKRAEASNDDEVGLLARSFNHMADELSGLYRSLEDKVDERTRQIRAAAEVAQNITSLSSLDDMLDKTVAMLVQQFGFYQASVFMTDRSGKYIQFKTGYGAATAGLAESKYRLEVGSESIIGWVSANNKVRVASDVLEDKLHLQNELLPQTRSEATVPISIGNVVLGVLDVQSTQAGGFNAETVVTLQTLASQIASAVQTVALSESTQINFEELSRLYRSSRLIAEANNEAEIFKASEQVLKDSPFSVLILALRSNTLETIGATNEIGESITNHVPRNVDTDTTEIEKYLLGGSAIVTNQNDAPTPLRTFTASLQLSSIAYIPIHKGTILAAIIILGTSRQILNNTLIQPYENFAELISVTLEKAEAIKQTDKHLREVESLASITESISTSSDLPSFFTALHEKVKQAIGNFSFIVALYDEKTDTISIPYSYENDQFLTIEPFPLGEGLTSILIRSQQPLFMVENTERRAAELGAKIQGKPAKSWMGAPMLVQNKPVGVLILQDTEKEHAFNDENFLFFTTLAGQVAGVINNVRLLDDSNRRAIQLESAAEIARDISGSLNLDELLIKAVNLIRERNDFYHAAVFLLDLPGEFAVIREATGEAGAQMKRQGYKIGVGSKSIVGFVTGRGEQLVVNDTARDATYYPNPLLPDTRAEAAFPLKVGERILGAMDVQSINPFAFSEDNLRSLQILADQMAIAVVNTELFAETQEHLSQHRLLHHITTTVASGTTLEEALESAVNGLQVTLGGDRIMILLIGRDKSQLEVKASIGYAEDVSRYQTTIGSGVVGWVAAQKKPLRIRDVGEDPRYVQISSNTRSELAIPLIYRNELLGVLNVESEQLDAYTENDEEMLGTLGGSLAAIIANARLLEQIRLQVERERVLYEVTSRIRRSTDIQSILTTTASELTRVTGSKLTRIKISPVIGDIKEAT
jgi:GAF domain-containing protein/HAMP domain-containing protein